ncbi:unnamed protein product, partial [Amoebophrya sp. A120]
LIFIAIDFFFPQCNESKYTFLSAAFQNQNPKTPTQHNKNDRTNAGQFFFAGAARLLEGQFVPQHSLRFLGPTA